MSGRGRVTVPTDTDIVEQTLAVLERWGGDAVRDCDGTEFPTQLREALKESGTKVYSTYYTTRKDNAWAKDNPDEIQQCYIMTGFHTAIGENLSDNLGDNLSGSNPRRELSIKLLSGISDQMVEVNTRDDITRWWEVTDRTTGETVPPQKWRYNEETGCVIISDTVAFHEYTVSFLAYLIWDPVHMYNAVVNDWKDFEKQITFDVRQPKTKSFSMNRLRRFLVDNPHVDVVRFTTFFHQFTLIFDELRREKYVDWYGYSASVSPYILERFEKEAGYPFRAEYIIDQGYYNNQYRVPSKEFKDFMAFQRREVSKLAREMVDICHEYGREAMMFLGDHFIGTEPYMDEFASIGLDAVVGSVGNGSTLRLISDIKGVGYTEGRFLPYFFPDTFHEGGNPTAEARENWLCARRAIMRSPIDRIGYGGYLKLALGFPDFMEYVAGVCDEFRTFYDNVKGTKPFCFAKAAVLNCWGKARSWGCHMVHHALYQKQNYSYAGVIEILSGAPYDVSFISFDDILENPDILSGFDAVLNVGGADTAHTGGAYWEDERVVTALRSFIASGGGFIGVGEPSGHPWQGRVLQLAGALGVEKENGFTLGYDKYNREVKPHFITKEIRDVSAIDFGEGTRGVYALEGADVLAERGGEVQLAANGYFKGRAVYMGGLVYSPENARLLHRALLWCAGKENMLHTWFSQNPCVDLHAYPLSGRFVVCNNSSEKQKTSVYVDGCIKYVIELEGGALRWFETP